MSDTTKEEVNILAAKWNYGADEEEPATFTEALNLIEKVMRERDLYRDIALDRDQTYSCDGGISREVALERLDRDVKAFSKSFPEEKKG